MCARERSPCACKLQHVEGSIIKKKKTHAHCLFVCAFPRSGKRQWCIKLKFISIKLPIYNKYNLSLSYIKM